MKCSMRDCRKKFNQEKHGGRVCPACAKAFAKAKANGKKRVKFTIIKTKPEYVPKRLKPLSKHKQKIAFNAKRKRNWEVFFKEDFPTYQSFIGFCKRMKIKGDNSVEVYESIQKVESKK